MIRYILILFILFPHSATAAKSMEDISNVNQIEGCWKRVIFSEKIMSKMNQQEPWPLQHQWYCFMGDGVLKTMHSSENRKVTSKTLAKVFNVLPTMMTYKLLQKGDVFIEHKESKAESYHWVTQILLNGLTLDKKHIPKGSILMTLYSRGHKGPVYYRFLKKIK